MKAMKCPKCSYVIETYSGFSSGMDALHVSVPGFEGTYCQACFAAWLFQNIPKMEEVK